MKKLFQIFSILLFYNSFLFAQLGKDSLSFSKLNFSDKQIINNFDKQLNTFNYSTLLKYFLGSDKLFFGIKENFNSTVTKSSTKNIKDEQFLWVLGQYDLSEKFKMGMMINNNFYTDDRDLAINKTSLLTTTVFTKFVPINNIVLTPFAGFSQNNQIGETNNGLIYGSEFNIDKYNFGDFDLSSLMKFQNEDISPRKNYLRLINFDLNSTFEESFHNSISADYSQQRKDFYFTADPLSAAQFNITNNIQSRIESNYSIQDRIKFTPANSPLSFDIQGRIAWRRIDRNTRYISFTNVANTNYDTRIEESRIDFASSADYLTDDINLSFRFTFSERDEKHLPMATEGLNNIIIDERNEIEQQKNNTSQFANISLLSKIYLSRNDKITFSIFHRKLMYDTPSILNYDDRDELLSIGRILFEKEFNPYFRIFVNLEGSLNKLVYIFAQRSSNNNNKRTLKFSSGGAFTTGNFSSSNSAEVSANYTVFDYEELNPNFRSYSFRQFVFRDSSDYKLSRKLRLFFSGYLKLSEQGDFKWSSFSSKPLRYLSEQYADPKIYYEFQSLSIGLGIRYFSLETFNYNKGIEKIKISDYRSIGPLAEISYVVGERINLKIYGWYEFIKSEDNTNREMANMSIKLNYKI
ncbi:MAG: hypothetical protein NTZ27_00755 [Ignavibacteriales bacterium]|nr:hypothetical protein [Ignavibacteriales bacterium]